MTESPTPIPPPALWLGLSGLIPFVGLAATIWLGGAELHSISSKMLEGYGIAILSFMGGCRWGFAAAGLGRGPVFWPLAISVLPALWGWAMLLLPVPFSLAGLAIGFVALFLADVALTRAGGAPPWWPRLRLPLTTGAALSLLAGAIGA